MDGIHYSSSISFIDFLVFASQVTVGGDGEVDNHILENLLCLTVEIAEALIVFHGLRLARDAAGICPILVKSDASTNLL
ncbi:hypothetical protein Dsin_027205 [Dipteronia sinensis]|uniref:Uncharacterized protein n=1 Tax=Dipteronia sinensis TaxID=43782 RepID=A0AAD9ZZA6_9ROSI|nr:hypothetical protein Dsin_027205 [Dipteronia sinensis]